MDDDSALEAHLERLIIQDRAKQTAKSTKAYEYAPLDTEFHIRVLSYMHPLRLSNSEKWGVEYDSKDIFELEDIEFEIVQVDLRKQPVYQALSYVWGDPSTSTNIRLHDGTTLGVTKNLRVALTKLVACVQVMPVWVDQLCINQSDLAERGHQVSIMGKIYLGAKCTIAWLGEEKEDCTKYLAYLIYKIRELPEAEKTGAKRKAWLESNVDLKFDPENPTIKGKCFRAIQEVLNRPWFRRAWVFQEAVLARSVVMMIGRHVFFIPELFNVVNDVTSLEYAIGGYRGSLSKTTTGWQPLGSMEYLGGDASRRSKSFLSFLWGVAEYLEATDRRDMVFAFLGLLNKPDLFEPLGFQIKPDYTTPLRELYINLTRTVIEGSRKLDVLGNVIGYDPFLFPKHRRLDDKLPSWVPDWAIATPTVRPFHRCEDNSFNASKGYQHSLVSSPADSETLRVNGKIISKIVHVINWDFDSHYFMDEDRSWLNLKWHLNEVLKVWQRSWCRKPTRERLLKTLLADGAWNTFAKTGGNPSSLSDQCVRDLLHAHDMWPRLATNKRLKRHQKKVEDDLWDLQQWSLITQKKRLAICENGYLAMVPRICVIDIGDADYQIAIMHGSATPMVFN